MQSKIIQAGFDFTTVTDWINVVIVITVSYATYIINSLKKDNKNTKQELLSVIEILRTEIHDQKEELKELKNNYASDTKDYNMAKENFSNRLTAIETLIAKRNTRGGGN